MSPETPVPIGIINATAPARICDNGGWTDTWFSGEGKIFNIAIDLGAEVQIEVFRQTENHRVILKVEDFNDLTYEVKKGEKGKHPMLEAAINRIGVPEDVSINVSVHSGVPYGSSTGSSAAICTALIGALAELSGKKLSREEIVSEALKVETVDLGGQSGIQDQICSVFGKINLIVMDEYPGKYKVFQPEISPDILSELESRLVVVTLGRHDSSHIHGMVIDDIEKGRRDKEILLNPLRIAAEKAMEALIVGDFVAFGRAMIENNDAQRLLHPKLISAKAEELFSIAKDKDYGALGWKVNGAGGDGGSITILCGQNMAQKRKMISEIIRLNEKNSEIKVISPKLSPNGIHVWSRVPDRK